jgi:hypothetical protein
MERMMQSAGHSDGVGSRAIKSNLQFINIEDDKQVLAPGTNIACWYDTCKFDTPPCYLPEKYVDDRYYVSKCFCSWNCVAKYNFEMNDIKMWYRHKLILQICKELYDIDDVVPAPPRGTLAKFGGVLTKEEFRMNSQTNKKQYRIIEPPMSTLLPIIEERHMPKKISNEIMDVTTESLVRKRSKPSPKFQNDIRDRFGMRNKD